MLTLDTTREECLPITVSIGSLRSLVKHYKSNPPSFHWYEIGWDIRRQFGEAGYKSFARLALTYDPPQRRTFINESWAEFDRPGPVGCDRLLLDEMAYESRFGGWQVPADVATIFAPVKTQLNAEHDAEHVQFAEWNRQLGEVNTDLQIERAANWDAEMDRLESDARIAAARLEEKVRRALLSNDFVRNHKGEPEPNNIDNVSFLLRYLKCEVRWNAWTERAEINGWEWQRWTPLDDTAVAKLRMRASQTHTRFLPGKEFLWDALLALAHANSVDPALDMLDELEARWDGQPRLSAWLSACCGVPCDPYHQAVSRHMIGSLVHRIRKPGAKVDSMTVFIGAQGTRKSTLCRILALRAEWFSDEIKLGDESKELVLSLAGKSVVEISELDGIGRRDMSAVKAMLSRQADRGRTAYARSVTDRPRRSIFVGTTNDTAPLQDDTGNRRFLPVRVTQRIDTDWLRDNLDQLVGEAAAHEARGETFGLPESVWGEAAVQQAGAREKPDYEILLEDTFARVADPVFISANDLRKIVQSLRHHVPAKRYGRFMRERLGFYSTTSRRPGGVPVAVWCRGSIDSARQLVVRQDGSVTFGGVLS